MGSPTPGIHNHKQTILWDFTRFSYSEVLILYSILLYWPYLDTGVLNSLSVVTFGFRIFLSYQSRRILLETELGSSSELGNTCGCPSSDGFNPGTSDPHCPFIRKRELAQLFLWVFLFFFFKISDSFTKILYNSVSSLKSFSFLILVIVLT